MKNNSDKKPNIFVLIPALNEEKSIGSRVLGDCEKGALLPQARFGNWLSTFLIRLFWGYKYTDLGPLRAIKFDKFQALDMKELTYGWTVEMQIKAAKMKYECAEVPIPTHRMTRPSSNTIRNSYRNW